MIGFNDAITERYLKRYRDAAAVQCSFGEVAHPKLSGALGSRCD